jgi:Uma2 family endonuclease
MAIQTKMTAAEFLQLPETTEHIELIDGEIVVAPSPRDSHQYTGFESAKYIERIAPHGRIRVSPIDLHLDESNVVQPDVMWNGPDSPCVLIDDAFWQGSPDLVLEILSPSTALRDKREKFRLYEKYGVREYWIADIP